MGIIDKINNIVDEGLKSNVFSFASVGVYYNYGMYKTNRYNINYKNKENVNKYYFDLASLTKPLATVLSLLAIKKNKKLNFNLKLSEIFDIELINKDKYNIKISDILNHSSGLPSYKCYFKDINNEYIKNIKEYYLNKILSDPLEYSPGSGFAYSDLGFILLGFITEKLTGRDIDEYYREKILGPIGLGNEIFFRRNGCPDDEELFFVPMEICPWRKRLIRGEVSDENCWALGGVAGHAGLFGDIDSVLDLTVFILDLWKGRVTHPEIEQEDLRECLKRREGIVGNTWALGFDTPTPGHSSSGRYLSPESVGHLGFTGTSFWIDPQRDLVIVLLTNRIHPSRNNEKIKEFRPYFHDRVVEILGLV